MLDVNKMAKKIVQAYSPMRKNDVEQRNKSWYDMVTTYAPNLSKNCKSFVAQNYDVKTNDIKLLQTHYLMFRDYEKNSNKFHYYAIYELPEEKFVAVNCSGRIGFIERTYDLTKKMYHDFATSKLQAERAMNAHLRSKLAKGYEEIKLRQGSVKVAYDIRDLVEDISDAYEALKKLNMSNKKLMSNATSRKFEKALGDLEDVMSSLSLQ